MGVAVGEQTVMAMSFFPSEGEPLWSRYSTHAVAQALETLPDEIKEMMSNVAVTVAEYPTEAQRQSVGLGPHQSLYGLYQGVPLTQRTSYYGMVPPDRITIFMYYILNEMPSGLRGLVTVGAIAAALSSTNSVLGAMASVAVEDLYRPYKLQKNPDTDEQHFLKASRNAVLFFAAVLALMAILSYFWQRASELSLIGFALGVMTFAYTGLLGVFFAAVFTKRGSARAVPFALVGGFLSVLVLQPYIFGMHIGFAWQMVLGTLVAFGIMQSDKQRTLF